MHVYLCALLAVLITTPLFAAVPATAPAATQNAMVYRIPPIEAFTPHGDPKKWTVAGVERGFRIDVLNEAAAHPASDRNAAPSVRLAWTTRGLALLVRVHDSTPIEAEKSDSLWERDSIEIVVSDPTRPKQILQFVISPGIDPAHPKVRTSVYDYRADKSAPEKPTIEAASSKTEDGYVVEALMPWTGLHVAGALNTALGFQIGVNDALSANQKIRYRWGNADLSLDKSADHQPLILADTASDPITFAVDGDYQAFRRYRIRISYALAERKNCELRDNTGKSLYQFGFPAGSNRYVVDLPYPEIQGLLIENGIMSSVGWGQVRESLSRLTLLADGRPVAQLTPGVPPSRTEALEQIKVRCNFVFSGTNFPPIDFEDPITAEDLLGTYSLSTRYFDTKLNEVTSAPSSGRYAAALHINGSNGLETTRLFTLYRLPGKLGRRETLEITAKELALPKDFGIDPAIASTQTAGILDAFKRNFLLDLSRADDGAIVLAALSETTADAPPFVIRTDPWSQNALFLHSLKKKLGLPTSYRYLEHLPPDYATDKDAKFPLIVFLHGSGERGNDLNIVKRTGFTAYLEKHPEFPAIVISPQCPNGSSWQPVEVNELLDQVLAKYRVDTNRIYMTGLSMGGYGTWAYAAMYPERIAAAVPICGIGDAKDMARLKNIPTWVFHGEADPTVPIEPDRKCVEALKAAGGNVQFTTYPGVGHDSWTQTYNNSELYTWMLAQRRKQP